MGWILGLFGNAWSRLVGLIVGAIGVVVAIFGWRLSIQKGARQKVEAEMQRRTLERIEHAKRVQSDLPSDGDAIRDRMRDEGWLR